MANFCPNCGNTVSNTSNFCDNCGEVLSARGVETTYSPYTPDRGLWQMFFQFRGRLNPKRFIIRTFFIYLMWFLIILVATLLTPKSAYKSLEPLIAISSLFLPIVMIPLCVRRSHDLGRPGWYFIIMSLPFLAAAMECFVERWGWKTIWGEYRERWRISETSVLFGAITLVLMSCVAVFVFAFSSGTHGDNEYGPDPTGGLTDTPPNTNPVLKMITHLEEKASTLSIVGIIIAFIIATEVFVTIANKIRSANFTPTTTATANVDQRSSGQQKNVVIQNNKETAQSESPQVPLTTPKTIKVPKPPTITPIYPENIESTSNNSSSITATQQDAINILTAFHDNITQKNYRKAYSCLSNGFQRRMNYDGWANGFATTVSSKVEDVKIWSGNDQQIVLTYVLKAVDRISGKQSTAYFSGTASMIKENGTWKINEVTNKKR